VLCNASEGFVLSNSTGGACNNNNNNNIKVQNVFHGQNNIACSTDCKYRTAATLYIIETWFIAGI